MHLFNDRLRKKTVIVNNEMKHNPKTTLAAIKNPALHHIPYFAVIRQSAFHRQL